MRFPGTQNSTDKVEEKEFTELCLSVHFSVTVCVVMSRQSFAEIRDWKGSDTTNIRYIFFKITHMLHTIVMSFNDGVYHFRISSQQ